LEYKKNGKNLKCPKILNKCEIKHKLKVPCASFEEKCAKSRTFSNTPFNMRGNHFLVHGTEKRVYLNLYLFKYAV